MRTSVIVARPWEVGADVLALPTAPAGSPPGSRRAEAEAEIDRRLGGVLTAHRAVGELDDELHKALLIPARVGTAAAFESGVAASFVLAIGTGPAGRLTRAGAVRFGAAVVRRLAAHRVTRLAIWLPGGLAADGTDTAELVELVARGATEGAYEPASIYRDTYEHRPIELEELILVVPDGDQGILTARTERGRIVGEGTKYARTLTNRAPNDLTPEAFADEAMAVANRHGLAVDVIGPDRARELGMGLFLAVGQGSDNPPRMIVLRSGADGATDANGRLVGLVGKGVTFDAGGINVKPQATMWEEKCDKAGGATVLAAVDTVARLAPGTPLLAVIPAVENLPGPHSTRPGDVVRALNGKSVEIRHTDAEGRLIMGDALTYAERLGATHLLGAATLSGITDMLGREALSGHGEPDAWWDEIGAAAASQGEPTFRFPLDESYRSSMDSWYAELSNIPGGGEGTYAQTGLFLREFRTVPWAWLDLSWRCWRRVPVPWAPLGATGDGLATIVGLALRGASVPTRATVGVGAGAGR